MWFKWVVFGYFAVSALLNLAQAYGWKPKPPRAGACAGAAVILTLMAVGVMAYL